MARAVHSRTSNRLKRGDRMTIRGGSIALLLVAFTLLRPGFWWDMIFPPLQEEPPAQLEPMVAAMEPGSQLIIEVQGEDINGDAYTKTLMLPVGDEKTGAE